MEQPNSKTRRGRVGRGVAQTLTTTPQQAVVVSDRTTQRKEMVPVIVGMTDRHQKGGIYDVDYISRTIMSTDYKQPIQILQKGLRPRKLTPKECFRLMGFDDSDFEKAESVNSNTQLYKQAGNSIVVPVVEHIIGTLFDCGAL